MFRICAASVLALLLAGGVARAAGAAPEIPAGLPRQTVTVRAHTFVVVRDRNQVYTQLEPASVSYADNDEYRMAHLEAAQQATACIVSEAEYFGPLMTARLSCLDSF